MDAARCARYDPYWIEEPTSPDDVLAHAAIRRAVAPIRVATGEHAHNRILFKQLLQAEAIDVVQIDACRVAGVNENLAILLLAAKFGVPVCPHAGGVGLCEMVQHLAMFDYVACPRRGTTASSSTSTTCTSTSRSPPSSATDGIAPRPRRARARGCAPSRWRRSRFPTGPSGSPAARRCPSTQRGGRMRAATYVGDQTFRIEERDAQAPGAGEVRLDVAYVGICGTDLHIKHGAMDARVCTPAVIGHEMSGTVAAVGRRRDGLGARRPGHGHAARLVRAVPRLPGRASAHLPEPGLRRHRLARGPCSSRWTVPARLLVRLPQDLALRPRARSSSRWRSPSMTYAARACSVVERVLVVGGGPIGTLIAAVATNEGAEVLVSEPDAFRRAVASELGLEAVDPGGDDVAAVVETWTAGAGADVAFEVSGSGRRAGRRDPRAARPRAAWSSSRSTPQPRSRRPVPLLLARAGAVRRAGLRAGRLRAGGRAAGDRRDPAATLISCGRAARAQRPTRSRRLEGGGGVMKVLIDCSRGVA